MARRASGRSVSTSPGSVALVGNFPPRECGIATFSSDLLGALRDYAGIADCYSVAMNDVATGYNYPPEVRFEVGQHTPGDYHLAARFLNMNRTGAVSLQHEYGIYGGESGCLVLELLDQLHMPVVTTLHTVLESPDAGQRSVLARIAERSDRLVVMSRYSAELLDTVYRVPPERVTRIPHGIPDLSFVDPAFYKDQFGVEGRRVILTFGLLSPGKGVEYVISAMPEIVRRYPETVYIVLGKTHPAVLRETGEQYRGSLHQLVRQLGVEEHVLFHNEFVDLPRLIEFLGCADVYVTPYLNEAQAVSGTLAYALGAGKAVVSTPYWYANEMLAEGRGVIVPFRNADAIAGAVSGVFSSPMTTDAMRKKAYLHCREMTWQRVANRYAATFQELTESRLRTCYSAWLPRVPSRSFHELPSPRPDHLLTMTDDTGILQHARFTVPSNRHGYTTDDNARALLAAVLASAWGPVGDWPRRLVPTYLGFLDYAFDERSGRFRNELGYDRVWRAESGSEDSHGRALWALGETVRLARDDGHVGIALELFERALPAALDFASPRAWSTTLLGIHAFRMTFPGARATLHARDELARRLMRRTMDNQTADWVWPEDILSYDNGRLPHALMMAGRDSGNEEMTRLGIDMLEWLAQVQTTEDGSFAPVGNQGWFERGGSPARYDQQPLEAEAMLGACLLAHELTGDLKWERSAVACMDWFLGRNDAGTPLYDYATGGCHDGLQAQGINQNEGAETTVSWLLALLSTLRYRVRVPTDGSADHVVSMEGGAP